MKIYTGTCGGKKIEKLKKYELGIMLSPSPNKNPWKTMRQVPCALDNGAFRQWQRGYPFMEKVFLTYLENCFKIGIDLDFIVCPDIVTGGKRSLDFSIEYAFNKMSTAQNLALAVQDGVTPLDVGKHCLDGFTHIFVGGTVDWKWLTAKSWVKFAHDKNMKCHIGRCGTLKRLIYAKKIKADSVDSTSFVRNENWGVIGKYLEDERKNGKLL